MKKTKSIRSWERDQAKKELFSQAEKIFLVQTSGTFFTVYLFPDRTVSATNGMAGFSRKLIKQGSKTWRKVMRAAKPQIDKYEVEQIMES